MLLAGGSLVGPGQAMAATATANATATVVAPISIAADQDLAFGEFAAGSGGTIVVAHDGTVTPTGVNMISGTATSPASFSVGGEADSGFTVTLPENATLTNGTETMTVDNFTSNGVTALTAGTATLAVGATLNVANGQATGSYSGTFDVSVEYN